MLEDAIEIAVQAHRGQTDKAGAPYVLHPLRMMCRVETEAEKIVAVLHDVIEDMDWTFEALRDRGFPNEILAALDCLSRREDETYDAFIERAKTNPLARRVKLADLEDNLDISRIETLSPRDMDRLNKYNRAKVTLMSQTVAETTPGPPPLINHLLNRGRSRGRASSSTA